MPTAPTAIDLDLITTLYRTHRDDLAQVRDQQRKLHADADPAMTPQLDDLEAEITYLLLRHHQPANVVEIGTYYGWSTSWILSALRDNGTGHLHSFDIVDHATTHVPEHLSADRWTFTKGDVRAKITHIPTNTDYLFIDASHFKMHDGARSEPVLVAYGITTTGDPVFLHLDGVSAESTDACVAFLEDMLARGLGAPVLTISDGAPGLCAALDQVFPAARHQRCWVHKARNVTNSLPKSAQSGATKAMQEIYNAEDRAHAEKAIEAFAKTYGAKFPKAVAKITDDAEELLAFYDFPAEHWIHLRTTNPIESTFATVRLRQRVTKGPGSRAAGVAMAFKLIESAQARWRAVNAPHLVALVRAGAKFEKGKLVERDDEQADNHDQESGGDAHAA
jgi:hypothetical protein